MAACSLSTRSPFVWNSTRVFHHLFVRRIIVEKEGESRAGERTVHPYLYGKDH